MAASTAAAHSQTRVSSTADGKISHTVSISVRNGIRAQRVAFKHPDPLSTAARIAVVHAVTLVSSNVNWIYGRRLWGRLGDSPIPRRREMFRNFEMKPDNMVILSDILLCLFSVNWQICFGTNSVALWVTLDTKFRLRYVLVHIWECNIHCNAMK